MAWIKSRMVNGMKMINRKEFAKEVVGFVLTSQKIKLHSNGAKITINKAFIKHGLLKPEQTYTIIFVHEEKNEGDD